MTASSIVKLVRLRHGCSLRRLAAEAGTSHATLSAYETGRVDPCVGTLQRVVASAGFAIEPSVVSRVNPPDRGDELLAVLDLAAHFPVRHQQRLAAPPFGRR
jgi:transcriptional regulator with XRE-family HTH domain